MLSTKLTPREILLLDGKLIIPVAARQLQRLLNTLSDYKKKAEKADNLLREAQAQVIRLETDLHFAEKRNAKLTRYNKELNAELKTLQNKEIKFSCAAVNLDLSDI